MSTYLYKIREQVLPVLKKHGVGRAGFFGSITRSDYKRGISDIDMLISFRDKKSLLDLIGVKNELEAVLGISVDLVEYHMLKPRIRDRVLSQELRII